MSDALEFLTKLKALCKEYAVVMDGAYGEVCGRPYCELEMNAEKYRLQIINDKETWEIVYG